MGRTGVAFMHLFALVARTLGRIDYVPGADMMQERTVQSVCHLQIREHIERVLKIQCVFYCFYDFGKAKSVFFPALTYFD